MHVMSLALCLSPSREEVMQLVRFFCTGAIAQKIVDGSGVKL